SSPRMAWLIAEGETPYRLAARVKLRSSATARKAANVLRSLRSIRESSSQAFVFNPYYSKTLCGHTLELGTAGNIGTAAKKASSPMEMMRNGKNVGWMAKVTDEQYLAGPQTKAKE